MKYILVKLKITIFFGNEYKQTSSSISETPYKYALQDIRHWFLTLFQTPEA